MLVTLRGGLKVQSIKRTRLCTPTLPFSLSTACLQRGPPLRAACSTAPAPADTSHLASIRHVIAPRQLPDEDLVVHEVDSVHMRLAQCGKLPDHTCSHEDLASHALALTDLMATGSVFRTLQILKRCPDLLLLEPYQVASKVLQLKLLLPESNIGELLYQKPSLLLLTDLQGVLTPALKKLKALMPGIPVERKLHEGGTVWWSFASLLESFRAEGSRDGEAG